MTARKDHRPELGSLEAALREISAPPSAEQLAPEHPGSPTEARPGEHTAATPRAFDQPEHREGYRLWGRCGYVPESRSQS